MTPKQLYDKQYYLDNLEKKRLQSSVWAKANPEKKRISCKKYHAANPHTSRKNSALRHSSKLQRTPPWSTTDEWCVFAISETYEASALRSSATRVVHHVDHIVPIQGDLVSGLHLPWNLRVLTAQENLAKGNRL